MVVEKQEKMNYQFKETEKQGEYEITGNVEGMYHNANSVLAVECAIKEINSIMSVFGQRVIGGKLELEVEKGLPLVDTTSTK